MEIKIPWEVKVRIPWEMPSIIASLERPPVLELGDEKVTVSVPWCETKMYCAEKFFENLARLQVPEDTTFVFTFQRPPQPFLDSHEPPTEQRRDIVPKQRNVIVAQNYLRQVALGNGSKYLFLIEADNFPPQDAYLRLKTLVEKYGADVANIPYAYHFGERGWLIGRHCPMCWRGKLPFLVAINFRDLLLAPYPFQVTSAGFGCTLFTRKVISGQPFWAMERHPFWCSDGTFAERVIKENLRFLLDNRAICPHLCCEGCYRKVYGEPTVIDVKHTIKTLFEGRKVVTANL